MKNLAIITLSLISLSTSFSLFPSLSLPSVPLYPSSLIPLFMKDPVKEITKIYCVLKNVNIARSCARENNQGKISDFFRKCMQKITSLKTLDEMRDFYCNKMNLEETFKAKACLDPGIMNMVLTDATFVPTILNCLFKAKNSEK
uniref:Uncharacterized protein n=1 Tax=Mesobuthus gibbosus TaxID=123226 RepID=A0A059U8Z3_MESGB|nr:hypothetical protein [Mesobuthus gibbosus]